MKKRFLGKHTKVSIDTNIIYIYIIYIYICTFNTGAAGVTGVRSLWQNGFNRTQNAMVSVNLNETPVGCYLPTIRVLFYSFRLTQSIKGVLLHPVATSWSMWGWTKIGQMGDFWEGWLRHATQRTANCYTFASGIVFSSKLLMLPSMS